MGREGFGIGPVIWFFSASDIYFKKYNIEKVAATPRGEKWQNSILGALISEWNHHWFQKWNHDFKISAKFHFLCQFCANLVQKFHWNQNFRFSKLQVRNNQTWTFLHYPNLFFPETGYGEMKHIYRMNPNKEKNAGMKSPGHTCPRKGN